MKYTIYDSDNYFESWSNLFGAVSRANEFLRDEGVQENFFTVKNPFHRIFYNENDFIEICEENDN